MTWRNVLDCKIAGTHIIHLAHMAYELGYKFICHNDRILFVHKNPDDSIVAFDTFLTVKSLEDNNDKR